MCLRLDRLNRSFAYHWAGDQIISPLVTAARRVPGRRATSLDIDVREFLAVDHSAEIRNFYFRYIVDHQPAAERERFLVGRKGNFDFRMQCVLEAFGTLKYRPAGRREREEWLLPAETLANGGGDCEDLAFLLTALLEESGISRSCVRLVFGRVVESGRTGRSRAHDHAWVVYQLESGAWMILDPVERVEQHRRPALTAIAPKARTLTYEYQPLFVCNRDHLWRVHGPPADKSPGEFDSYLSRRKVWENYHPEFAIGVHNSLFDEQMKELSGWELLRVKMASIDLDLGVLSYDPRDHCDFAYVDESWRRISQRLQTGNLGDLGRACHTVADFYAHSLYAHVVQPVGGELPLYDPAHPLNPGAAQDEVFNRANFPINNDHPALDEAATRAFWGGRLISGQWWRSFTTYPNDIQVPGELDPRRCLPDHDNLAVDDATTSDKPAHLYAAKATFNRQFALRKNAAERHVRAIFLDWKALHP